MKYAIAVFAATAVFAGGALAQDKKPAAGAAGHSAMKLSQAECTTLWQQAGGGASGLTAAQSKSYVSDFKAANPDGDTTIDQTEWMTACNKGLVHSTASSGASSGTAGSSSSSDAPAARPSAGEHPPTKRMDDAVPDMKSKN